MMKMKVYTYMQVLSINDIILLCIKNGKGDSRPEWLI